MTFLHEMRWYTDANYMMANSAQQAIIEEIQGLRQDLRALGSPLSEELTYAIFQLCRRLENL